ncbi:hypothetical protein C8J56DRAFT_1110578 [Mycena floridula]|nr:hypothetical protein C8J56DRAFT_1110578 [Mycena floridula]
MAKSNKKTDHSTRPITSFFTRKSASGSQPLASSSTSATAPATAPPSTRTTRAKDASITADNSESCTSAPKTRSQTLSVPQPAQPSESRYAMRSRSRSTAPSEAQSFSISARIDNSAKRPRSRVRSQTPDASSISSARKIQKSSECRPDGKRKAPFEPEPELLEAIDESETIVITRPSTGSPDAPRKKRKLSPEVIPSSQSDEMNEMDEIIPDSQPGEEELKSPKDLWQEDAMLVVGLPSPAASSPLTPFTPDESGPSTLPARPSTPSSFPSQQHTPPPSEAPSHHISALQDDSPIRPINPEEKTAAIIARVQAEQIPPSPEVAPIVFNDELDDSSDDEGLNWLLGDKGKGKEKAQPRDSPATSPTLARPRRSVAPPKRGPVTVVKQKAAAKKSVNPLDQLLKEKKTAEKNGRGEEAFKRAEEQIIASRSQSVFSASEVDDLDDSMDNWGIEGFTMSSSDRNRLLGKEAGQAISNILEADREMETLEVVKEAGVPLFVQDDDDSDVFMDSPCRIPSADFDAGDNAVLGLFKSSIERQAFAQACLLLDSRALANVQLDKFPSVVAYLCDIAFSTDSSDLPFSALCFLLEMWSGTCITPGVSLLPIIDSLVRLGASPSILQSFGWTPSAGVESEQVDKTTREKVLFRIVALTAKCAEFRRLSQDEIPEIILMLLVIGLDPLCSDALKTDIISAISVMSHSLGADETVELNVRVSETYFITAKRFQQEVDVCNKILGLVIKLEPVNQALVVSLLNGGSRRAARIAQWVAYSLIAGVKTIGQNQYGRLPPLMPILGAISGQNNSVFKLHEATDYVDVGLHTQICGVALSNIDAYITDVDQASAMLEHVINAIETLHSNIGDTRAAHLDRSRTKGMLKQLSMKVHYQRVAADKLRKATLNPKKTLRGYFNKPSTSA